MDLASIAFKLFFSALAAVILLVLLHDASQASKTVFAVLAIPYIVWGLLQNWKDPP